MTRFMSASTLLPFPGSSAVFSDDMIYRYSLTRAWNQTGGRCVFIGLNPSTADEIKNDNTVRLCIGFAKSWGYGALTMLNAFAFRSTYPRDLYKIDDPIGPDNDKWILDEIKNANLVVAAWGVHGKYLDRHNKLIALVPFLHCIGITKDGFPRHPLYSRKDTKPVIFNKGEKE